MTMKRVELKLVASTTEPGSLGMRTPDGGLFGHIRSELVKAGFKPGDRVMIVPLELLQALEKAANEGPVCSDERASAYWQGRRELAQRLLGRRS